MLTVLMFVEPYDSRLKDTEGNHSDELGCDIQVFSLYY